MDNLYAQFDAAYTAASKETALLLGRAAPRAAANSDLDLALPNAACGCADQSAVEEGVITETPAG